MLSPKIKKNTASLVIFLQVLTVLWNMGASVAEAAAPEKGNTAQEMLSTMSGIHELVNEAPIKMQVPEKLRVRETNVRNPEAAGSPATVPPVLQPGSEGASGYFLPGEPVPSRVGSANDLPSLNIKTGPKNNAAAHGSQHKTIPQTTDTVTPPGFSSELQTAAGLVTSARTADAAINYARGLGAGLLNQKINDWLNQAGTGRVSLDSDGRVTGDFLIPLYDAPDDLLFTQLGTRRGTNRNIVNLGGGWRHYAGDWMYGLNGFWDYDLTGKNNRMGVGAEAWTNYLKLAANGYFGLTDWHQSPLDTMRDYDERPATGFDIRTEAYLPAYPQLGATLKYEKYFGKGVDISGSASVNNLRDSPAAFSYGLAWTPFPLMTLNATRTSGDYSDNQVGVSFTYRPGVPLSNQLDPDSVDLTRSLAGNRYDLVDRNYDIVMQYRKQTLLSISLPARVSGKATDTVSVNAKVNKSKYGLKDIAWTISPAFATDGGTLKKLSPHQVQLILPAYNWTTHPDGNPQTYTLSAVASDTKGNRSEEASTVISVSPSDNTIGALTLSPDGQVADGKKTEIAMAQLVFAHASAVAGQSVTFTAPGLTLMKADGTRATTKMLIVQTGSDGSAKVKIKSTKAGVYSLTAKMANGNYKTATTTFVADASTATLADGALTVTPASSTADGKTAKTVSATVTDANGNPVSGAAVSFSTTLGTLSGSSATSGADGVATVTLTGTAVGTATVTAKVGSGVQTATTTFVIDPAAKLTLNVETDNAVADGKATDIVIAKVTSANGNPITGTKVTFTLKDPMGNPYKTGVVSAITNNEGMVTLNYYSTVAGISTATATVEGITATATVAVNFVAGDPDGTKSSFSASPTPIVADGSTVTTLTLMLKDANGNAISGVAKNLGLTVTDSGGSVVSSGVTVSNFTEGSTAGIYSANLVSTTANTYTVKPMYNSGPLSNLSKEVGFYRKFLSISIN